MTPAIARIELQMDELDALLARALAGPLAEDEYQKLKAALHTLGYLTQLVENKNMTIHRLRQILFGAATEKTRQVLQSPQDQTDQVVPESSAAANNREPASNPAPGHGRNRAQDYPGADRIEVGHPSLSSGDRCPECQRGKLYPTQPGLLVRVIGQAPLHATVYELEKLRCNLCGEVFTAPAPAGVGAHKYDARSAAMIALLKYGSGVPFHRLQRLQGSLGIPLPASTQWEIAEAAAGAAKPAYAELIRQAAQGEVLHNDDTTAKILALMAANAASESADEQRTGIFTSGIVATSEQHKIALFFTGRQHAGENLAEVLAHRASQLGPPMQMCDALSRNLPGPLKTILANCTAHARRKFVEVAPSFPEECKFVLEILAQVYQHDALCKTQRWSREQRLHYHQAHSSPLMQDLRNWLDAQFTQHQVEPNSGLGQAISYMRKHWEKLTLFLRQAGAPLDNNICERALKLAILNRKNSMFYRTQNGADVGDLFMSLIHTCQLCSSNPFEYLTTLQEHRTELVNSPAQWMPWNYTQTLQQLGTS